MSNTTELTPVDFRKFKKFNCVYGNQNGEFSYYRNICRNEIRKLLVKHGLVFHEQVNTNFDDCLFIRLASDYKANTLSYSEVFEQIWTIEDKIDFSLQELDNLINMLKNDDFDVFIVGIKTLEHLSIGNLKYLRKDKFMTSIFARSRVSKKHTQDSTILVIYYIIGLL